MQTEKPEERDNRNAAPLISVIVPIYNVERYVRKCLDSLKGQTLKEIEVICIDDGSTDSSGRIADEYAAEDERFRVIHTENRGLSAARNRGIDESRADWLMFVDSDDWVHEDFCRVPYEKSLEYGADLVIFDHYLTKQIGKPRRIKTDQVKSGIVSSISVIRNCGAWNKLYKRNLFDDIRYPEGHVYEDIATTHKIIQKSDKIYRCGENLYYYRIRGRSITKCTSSRTDAYVAKYQRYKDFVKWGYATKEDKTYLQVASLDYCGQAGDTEEKAYQTAINYVEEIIEGSGDFDVKHKLKLLIWKINRNVYRGIYLVCGKQMKK